MVEKIIIHFFNVGEGDSTLIEFISETPQYVLIDSNLVERDSEKVNPAYEFLMAKNASEISTLIITHLHMDHYNGIEKIPDSFAIQKIVVPPFLSTNSKQYKLIFEKIKESIRDIVLRCNDDDVLESPNSLAHLLVYLKKNSDKIEEASGSESRLRFPNIDNYFGTVYLPLRKIKSILHQIIVKNEYDLNQFPQMNDSSIAFQLTCFGYNILLTGDSTKSQW